MEMPARDLAVIWPQWKLGTWLSKSLKTWLLTPLALVLGLKAEPLGAKIARKLRRCVFSW